MRTQSITLLAVLMFGALSGAAIAAPADSSLYFDVDYARFRINNAAVQAEFYLSLPRQQLHFAKDGEDLVASFASHIAIALGDSEVANHSWTSHTIARDSTEVTPAQLLFTQAQFQLPENDYRVHVRIMDLRSNRMGVRSLQVQVKPYDDSTLALSDLEIASRVTRDTTVSQFYKNRHTVIPNPSAAFGVKMPMLNVYSEIYNLTFPSDSSYSVSYRIFDGEGNLVKSLPPKIRPIAGRQIVDVSGFNVLSLPGGTYYLEVRVADAASGKEAFRRHKFFVYREEEQRPVATAADAGFQLMQHTYRDLTEKDLDEEFKTLRYVATNEERKIYSSLDLNGKRDFLVKFWQIRDRSPETPRNEYREEYLDRVNLTNAQFSGLRPGWSTDMGRVMLVYGNPDEFERYPSSSENRPYQVWKYFEIEGGVEFIFVDVNSWGEYQLVHSSARGELSDADWARWINPSR